MTFNCRLFFETPSSCWWGGALPVEGEGAESGINLEQTKDGTAKRGLLHAGFWAPWALGLLLAINADSEVFSALSLADCAGHFIASFFFTLNLQSSTLTPGLSSDPNMQYLDHECCLD